MGLVWWILLGAAAFMAACVVLGVVITKSKQSGSLSANVQKETEANLKAIAEEQEKAAAERAVKKEEEAQRQAAIRKEVFDKLSEQGAGYDETPAKKEPAKKPAKKVAPVEEVKEEPAPAPVEEAKAEPVKEEVAVAEEKPVKKAPAKKPAAKKETVKKEATVTEEKPAKKAPAKKAAATAVVAEEKPVAKKAPAKKAATTAVVAEEKPAKKAPAKKAEAKAEEKPVAKKAPAKKAEPLPELTDDADTDTLARYAGKWEVYHMLTDDNSDDDMYFFELRASNGEKLLSSEEYTSYQGAVRGIETHKQNILKGNLKITLSKKGDYIVKLLSGSGQLLCTGENYANKARCESAIKSIKRFARTAVLDENVHDFFLKMPKEDDSAYVATAPAPAEGVTGKWIISNREDADEDKVFYFELFANNGEKLLSSEEYTTYAGAVSGLQTHKQNIAKGNFRITLTKKGDYIYKILNGNGQLLCLGEHYKSKVRCQNAVESVKRFAENSPVLTDSEQKD